MIKTIGGITFDDPYAWLQADTEEALVWQKARTEEAVSAARDTGWFDTVYASGQRHAGLHMELVMPPRRLGGRWFWRDADGAIFVGDSPKAAGRALVTPADLVDADDPRPAQVWFFEPSPDGRWCAVAYAPGGDTDGWWVVVDVASGAPTAARVPSLLFNSPRPGWLPGGAGFYLADRTETAAHRLSLITPEGTLRNEVTFSPSEVPLSVPSIVPQVAPEGRWVAGLSAPHELVVLQLGDVAAGTWRPFLPRDFEGECYGDWLDGDTYLAIVTDGAPRGRLVAIPAATSRDRSTWREVLSESEAVLRTVVVTSTHVVLLVLRDVSLGIELLDHAGAPVGPVPVPPYSATMRTLLRITQPTEELVIDRGSFLEPPAAYRVDTTARVLDPISEPAPALEGVVVRQEFAAAADGTRIPYFVIHRVGIETGSPQPTLVYAYGGYNAPITPTYLGHIVPFVDAGGVFVVANIRGGGEYGSAWHLAARRHTKQTTFDDLYAVAEQLIAAGATTPDLLALTGFSNGGSTAGIALVQRPDLWRVVAPGAPQFDWMEPVGPGPASDAMRSYATSEYGDPDDPADAAVIFGISAYHNIRDGVAYPAVFSTFGASDPGCAPYHGRRFTARLRDATSSGRPVHLRVWPDTGHGGTGDLGVQWNAEWLAFVMQQLGMTPPG